jgi:RHS repeat-associated protein
MVTVLYTYYYYFDGLGSVVALARGDQPAEETYSYDVFGKPTIRNAQGGILTTSAFGNRYMFTGREWEPETGLYYYRARYYKAEIGRFLQPDPVAMFMQYASVQAATKGNIPGTYLTPAALAEFLRADPVGKFVFMNTFGRIIPANRFGAGVEFNLYAYCWNDPFNGLDPYGLMPDWWYRGKADVWETIGDVSGWIYDSATGAWEYVGNAAGGVYQWAKTWVPKLCPGSWTVGAGQATLEGVVPVMAYDKYIDNHIKDALEASGDSNSDKLRGIGTCPAK